VLYGMGFRTEVEPGDNVGTAKMAAKLMDDNIAMTRQMRSQLPKNRDLMKKISEYGLQPV
jgi:tryptophan halogenase